MKTQELKTILAEAAETDIWTVTLKKGGEVVCRSNPKQSCMEVAYQQTIASETLLRGDIIYPREISALDNQ